MASTTTTQATTTTISDMEYKELLAQRLAAKHAYEAGRCTKEVMLATRAAVRRARKVRASQGEPQAPAPTTQAMTKPTTQAPAPTMLVMPQERRVRA